ncbi:metal ABC transporter solute-binding protein, Zn/Mn family [Geomicrobium sp. JCM 19037]|uniref:metal ABC transporter solute-binding protein, Zn/Mn family n=1 Tax=Geomicrobium sp. JCM 19037 TaxID=1460634 RepID=UPI0005A764C5|nr:zinc ABC transporter substrate-binding protein [Geomicrobium sp. JCM 19037]
MKNSYVFFLGLAVILTACMDHQQQPTEGGNDILEVSTTLFALEDFVNKIGGDFVEAESIYPPNADAHTFEPSSTDFVKLAEQDVFIYSGVGLEPFADTVEDVLDDENVYVIAAGEHIPLRGERSDEDSVDDPEVENHPYGDDIPEEVALEGVADHYHTGDTVVITAEVEEALQSNHWQWYTRNHTHHQWEAAEGQDRTKFEAEARDGQEIMLVIYDNNLDPYVQSSPVEIVIDDHDGTSGMGDPHVFLDPILSIEIAENIKEVLIELLPEERETFERNFEKVKTELEKIDDEFRETFAEADHHQIIVSHAAYGYWEERYGLEQLSVHGLSTTQEPSQADLVEIVEVASENNIQYVTFENNVSSTISEVIQSEIGAESLILRNMESISHEDLENEEDYFSMMRMNIDTLEIALNDDK